MARFTLWGLYQYDSTLFDNIILPTDMDKETLINAIMSLSGQLYPYHQVPAMFKLNAEFWFKRNRYNFEQMFTSLNSEYNPLENYDRKEDSTETPNILKTNGGSDSLTSSTSANSTTGTSGSSSSSATNTDKTSAYDSEDFTNANQNSNSDSSTTNMQSTSTDSNTLQSTNTYGRTEAETGSRTYTSRVHGNIGVTTSQQMIEAELKLRHYDLYKQIAMMFEHELLIQVY